MAGGRIVAGILVAACVLDATCAAVLYWTLSGSSWPDLTHLLSQHAFQHEVNDILVLAAFRLVCIAISCAVGLRVGRQDARRVRVPNVNAPDDEEESGCCGRRKGTTTYALYSAVEAAAPEDDERASHAKFARADRRRHICVGVAFTCVTLTAFATAIKCIVFDFNSFEPPRDTIVGGLIASGVAWTNLEFYLFKVYLSKASSRNGHLIPLLHHHPLHYVTKAITNWCDMCNERIRQGEAYRCNACDWDVCVDCFRLRDTTRGEGLLRTDKGVVDPEHQLKEIRCGFLPSCCDASTSTVSLSTTAFIIRSFAMARPFACTVVLAITCLGLNMTARLFLPRYQGKILDAVVGGRREEFQRCAIAYVVLGLVWGFFGALRRALVDIVGRSLARQVRDKLYWSLLRQDIAFFDGMTTGQITSRLTHDVDGMVRPMELAMNTLVTNGLLLLGGLVMCVSTSWRLSMLALTAVCPMAYVTDVYAGWSQHINRQIYEALADANSVATEAFTNIRTVRAFATGSEEWAKYAAATAVALKKGILDAWGASLTFAFTDYVSLTADGLILWFGGSLVIGTTDSLTVGELITFQLYWNMMNEAFQALDGVVNEMTQAGAAAQRVYSLMDMEPAIPDDEGPTGVDPIVGDVTFTDVGFTYQMRPDESVLQGIHLTIPANTTCALVGRSGSGKSTLMHLIMRFYDPRQGMITVDAKNLRDLPTRWYHRQIGLVQQDTQLFGGTIEENIAYGMSGWTSEEVIEAARMANADTFIQRFADGYQTRVGDRGQRLSGGQKQRIAIARVLLRRPKIVLLDEATSALDTESEAVVQDALDKMISTVRGGCTVVLIAHRLSTVVNADLIAVVDDGRIVERGTHDELLTNNGVYRNLVRHQLRDKRTRTEGESQDSQPLNTPLPPDKEEE